MSERGWVTIGQLAAYAGVTVRTVRHYEQRGLLPEPERDGSGYRRYGARAVIDLTRIRTLAEAGVPLARIGELLDAPAGEFAEALHEIEEGLRQEAAELERRRERVAALASGEHGLLPDVLAAWLADLRDAGIAEEAVLIERDAWVLALAADRDKATGWIEEKRRGFRDPELRQLYFQYEQVVTGDPDEAELRALLRATLDYTARNFTMDDLRAMAVEDPDIAAMMFRQVMEMSSDGVARYHEVAREIMAEHPLAQALPADHPLLQP